MLIFAASAYVRHLVISFVGTQPGPVRGMAQGSDTLNHNRRYQLMIPETSPK